MRLTLYIFLLLSLSSGVAVASDVFLHCQDVNNSLDVTKEIDGYHLTLAFPKMVPKILSDLGLPADIAKKGQKIELTNYGGDCSFSASHTSVGFCWVHPLVLHASVFDIAGNEIAKFDAGGGIQIELFSVDRIDLHSDYSKLSLVFLRNDGTPNPPGTNQTYDFLGKAGCVGK